MAEEIKAVKLKTRETEDTLYYKVQADECRKELNEAQYNLYNATQQIESMVEEKKSLMTTIVNKNKHIRESENKAAESAEDTRAAIVWYKATQNRFKDEIHKVKKQYVRIQKDKDHLQKQLQTLKKIKNAEAQDQRKMIDHLKKKMAEVENENDIISYQSEKEKITSQRTITNLQNNIRTLSEEMKESKKRFASVTDKLRGAEQKVIELTEHIDDQTQNKENASAKLDKLEKENEYLVNQLRSNEIKIKLLNTSYETELNKHESAMKWMHARCSENEIELEKHKNAHFNLVLQLDRVHNYSRISMEETALFDKTFIEQKLEDERSKEEDLAEVTTNVIKKFASVKDRHGVIKSFQKRFEKGSCPSPFGNEFLSDEVSHMERFPTAIHEHSDNKQYNERLKESKTTKNCHNKTEKNTNVFNISMNIAKSNVSFIDKKEERTLRLNGGSSDHKAIEGKEQL